MSVLVRVFPLGLLKSNVYLVYEEETREAMIIDAGGGSQYVMREIRKEGLKPKFILLTHGHFDHTFELADFREVLGVEAYIHKEDVWTLETLWDSGLSIFGLKMPRPSINKYFEGEPSFKFGSQLVKVIHTPGHTPGSVCYFLSDASMLFTGDTLFQGSIGRTDLPGGNPSLMKKSLKKLLSLDDEVVIYPGHGPRTTMGKERKSNPFLLDLDSS
ncbi:MAG: MBL fold metallo-hydrolase [Thermoproteota archaeon]|nr:MAG: MBL fold metallo-hydrolase [Candidatus Korarchaeota archaeon]